MTRLCARPGCSAPAGATLAYDYQTRTTWLDPLIAEAHPMSYDLCDAHADAQVVPRGWHLEDRRDLVVGDPHPQRAPSFEGAFAI